MGTTHSLYRVGVPGDFVPKVEQIKSHSNLISISNFASPSNLTIRSSVDIILISDPCIFNLYNLCQTGSSYVRQVPHQCPLHFNAQTRKILFLLLQPFNRPFQLKLFYCGKGCIFASNLTLCPCQSSHQNHLVLPKTIFINSFFVISFT